MPTAEDYPWKSDLVRVTMAVVFMSTAGLILHVVWPRTSAPNPAVFAACVAAISPASPSRVRHVITTVAVFLPVALVVLFIAHEIRPLHSQPWWAYFLSNALAGWIGGTAAIWVTWLRAKRRHASRTTTLDQADA
ncbi:hypothetical protein [Dactylosporangium sp. NPDC051484]|uniref:hypothetical protein n=1 Tax=Dactylosporangium sp. NPDC051484 TaxID=3154942 RepID=UPI00344ED1DD